jgi:hypothetical protein
MKMLKRQSGGVPMKTKSGKKRNEGTSSTFTLWIYIDGKPICAVPTKVFEWQHIALYCKKENL